ncbi:NAD-dependent epimerase/dehydratase family protein [Bradyrhizobium sp. B120]|uniref:NAD-dependent epimerase/dehydratase family protein n=1 Tax=Bradyrhizobium sp. B120 TaxID=3410088 RepID=UPI003B9824C9
MTDISEPDLVRGEKRALRRVFVTGGSGFVGSHLIRELRAQGSEVVALARSEAASRIAASAGAAVHTGDLTSIYSLSRGMAGCDTVFHAGAYLPDWNKKEAFDVNVVGSRNVVEAALRAGVERIVYVSGIGVMIGSGPVRNVDESVPRGRPVGVLAASRIQSEREMQNANRDNLNTVIVRFPYVWGPRKHPYPGTQGRDSERSISLDRRGASQYLDSSHRQRDRWLDPSGKKRSAGRNLLFHGRRASGAATVL